MRQPNHAPRWREPSKSYAGLRPAEERAGPVEIFCTFGCVIGAAACIAAAAIAWIGA